MGSLSMLNAAQKCKTQSTPSQEIVNLTSDNFTKIIKGSHPVIINVYANWCSPCKALAPVFYELNKELGNRYQFVKMNADEQKSLTDHLNVSSYPTLIFFKNGKEIGRSVGACNKVQLTSMIENYLDK